MKRQESLKKLSYKYSLKRDLGDQTGPLIEKIARFIKDKQLFIEFGCGSGRILVPLAQLRPNTNFLGIDIVPNTVYKLNNQRNIKFLRKDFNNLDFNRLPKADGVIIFQAIHFINNLKTFTRKLNNRLEEKSLIIIATTTHRQFRSLPYCLAFPRVLNLELRRTPDLSKILDTFSQYEFKEIKKYSFKVFRSFDSIKTLKKWILLRPFSVLNLISEKEFQRGVSEFLKMYGDKKSILVDEFSVFILRRSSR